MERGFEMKKVSEMTNEEIISYANAELARIPTLKSIYKPSNLKIIEIDGLDCVGKETFAKELRLFIKKELHNAENRLIVEVESFPGYNHTLAGKLLFRILRDDALKNNIKNWRELFHIDQYDRLKEIYEYAKSERINKVVFILDRGCISNAIYRAAEPPLVFSHSGFLQSMSLLEPWYGLFGGIDVLVLMGINENEIEQYKELLESKENKDNNEVIDYQLRVNNILHKMVLTPINNLFSNLGRPIPVFSTSFKETWGNIPNPNYKPFIHEEYDKIQWTNISIHRLITQTINEIL